MTTLSSNWALGIGLLIGASLAAHQNAAAQFRPAYPNIGSIDRFADGMDALIPEDAVIEVVASGLDWSEGPVWVADEGTRSGGYLLFSDIPHNVVLKWQEFEGLSTFMKPSGYTGVADFGREPGSNGLALDAQGRLVLCEHGDRRISRLTKGGGKITLADRWDGKRFNSPNDLAIHASGDIYFTDPIYGLPQRENDPMRETDFCGVYRLTTDGEVLLQTKEISRPNGIAFAPDQKTLYVANSDGRDGKWRAFPVQEDGNLGQPSIFFDSTTQSNIRRSGGDGLKVDVEGHVFATGGGGVLVLSPEGALLGRLRTGTAISNVAFGDDGTSLYLTADMYLCRVRTSTKGW